MVDDPLVQRIRMMTILKADYGECTLCAGKVWAFVA